MKYVLGIDVGGTKIAAGLVDKRFKVSKVKIIRTSDTDLINQLVDLIKSYEGFRAIGLALPGQILPNGLALKMSNITKFERVNFKTLLENKFRLPVHVMNDAKAFGLAEATLGSGKHYKVVAGVVLGTGVGVGVVINKKVYFGKDSLAGELEHVTLLDGQLIRHYRKVAGFFSKVKQTEKFVRTILSMVVLSFNPDIIIIGGGWGKLPGMERLANKLLQNVGGYVNKTPIKVSKMDHPGIVGAVLPLLKK